MKTHPEKRLAAIPEERAVERFNRHASALYLVGFITHGERKRIAKRMWDKWLSEYEIIEQPTTGGDPHGQLICRIRHR